MASYKYGCDGLLGEEVVVDWIAEVELMLVDVVALLVTLEDVAELVEESEVTMEVEGAELDAVVVEESVVVLDDVVLPEFGFVSLR